MKIRTMKHLLAAVIVAMMTFAVQANGTAKSIDGFEVKAKSNLPEQSKVILSQIVNDQLKILDTAIVSNGAFSFAGSAEKDGSIFYVTFGTANPPGIPLILADGDKVSIEVSKDKLIRYTAKGGKYMSSIVKLHNVYTDYDQKMMDFNEEVATYTEENVTPEIRKNVPIRYNKLISERSFAIENFIRTEPASPATYFASKFLFQKPVPKIIMLGKTKMEKELPNSPYTKKLVAAASTLSPTVPGAIAPDIQLLSPDGDSVALSSLRGKVVLIDFWASWCGPCIREVPALKKVYNKYKDRGFEIYGVSLDNNAAKWKGAIAKYGLPWYHVSDLRGWQSVAGKMYGVRSIPATFLIDQEGRIIKSGMRAHELDVLLGEILTAP